MRPKIIFRADGNSKMGLGHVVRSAALAQMLGDDFQCHFTIRDPLPELQNEIMSACDNLHALPSTSDDIEESVRLAQDFLSGDEIVVLDGYHFKTEYQRRLRDTGCRLVCIDDICAYHFIADMIINHSGGVDKADYSAEPYTRFLLGPRFALIRSPFRKLARNRRSPEYGKRNLILCLGGADPENQTLSVLKTIRDVQGYDRLVIIVGAGYTHGEELENFLAFSNLLYDLHRSVSADELAQLMHQCQMAITSPSTVAYEFLSCGGIPYLKVIAENQFGVRDFLLEEQLAFDLDQFPVTDESLLQRAMQKANEIFDGKQSRRLRKAFRRLLVELRDASDEDCDMYFEWANDAEARLHSYNPEQIPFPAHQRWFFEKLRNSTTVLLVGEYHGTPFGQIRFDHMQDKDTYLISYSVDSNFRGKSFGSILLEKGIEKLNRLIPGNKTLIGFVKESNVASIHTFINLGFLGTKSREYPNSRKFTMYVS